MEPQALFKSILTRVLGPQAPLVILDIGARNNLSDMPRYQSLATIVGFEPSPQSQDRLINLVHEIPSVQPKFGQHITVPMAVGKAIGSAILYLSRRPGASSLLKPNAKYLENFEADNWSQMGEVVGTVNIPTVTLAEVIEKTSLEYVDFLKLDTQGSELEICKSAAEHLAKVEVIKTEINFLPIYDKMPMAHEVIGFLCDAGFELVDIEIAEACRRFQACPTLYGQNANYRLVWGDAIFVRAPHDVSRRRSLAQSAVLAGLGYVDLAIWQIQRNQNVEPAEREQLIASLKVPPVYGRKAKLRFFLRRLLGPWLGRPMPNKQVGRAR